MELQAVVQAFTDALNSLDRNTVASNVSNDFHFSGGTPKPIGAEEWFGLVEALCAAFPDLQLNYQIVSVEGNVAKTTRRITGTHTEDLDLSILDMRVIPATGKPVSQPTEEGEMIWEGDKLASIRIQPTEGGGLIGILTQLGIEPPAK